MQNRFLLRAFMLFALATAGCAESAWEYTINPDGSGKVDIEARLIPLPGPELESVIDPSVPLASIARQTASRIVAATSGVEAWRDVAWGITSDGRIEFSGTAYFRSLGDLVLPNMKPFMSALRPPELRSEQDGSYSVRVGILAARELRRLEHLLDSDELKGLQDLPVAEVTDSDATRGLMLRQALRPVASAALTTMKTTVSVRAASSRPADGTGAPGTSEILRVVVDGEDILGRADRLARDDPIFLGRLMAEVRSRRASVGDRKHGTGLLLLSQSVGQLRLLLYESERVPEVALPADTPDAFDFEVELAEALALETEIGGDRPDRDVYWCIRGGVSASGRTDSGNGDGWHVSIARGKSRALLEEAQYVEFSRARYEDSYEDDRSTLTRLVVGTSDGLAMLHTSSGLAFSYGENDGWSAGTRFSFGVGKVDGHFEALARASFYAWLAEHGRTIDADYELELQLVGGVRF